MFSFVRRAGKVYSQASLPMPGAGLPHGPSHNRLLLLHQAVVSLLHQLRHLPLKALERGQIQLPQAAWVALFRLHAGAFCQVLNGRGDAGAAHGLPRPGDKHRPRGDSHVLDVLFQFPLQAAGEGPGRPVRQRYRAAGHRLHRQQRQLVDIESQASEHLYS